MRCSFRDTPKIIFRMRRVKTIDKLIACSFDIFHCATSVTYPIRKNASPSTIRAVRASRLLTRCGSFAARTILNLCPHWLENQTRPSAALKQQLQPRTSREIDETASDCGPLPNDFSLSAEPEKFHSCPVRFPQARLYAFRDCTRRSRAATVARGSNSSMTPCQN